MHSGHRTEVMLRPNRLIYMLRIRSMVRLLAMASTLAVVLSAQPLSAQTYSPDEYRELARALLEELTEINTTHSTGNTTDAAVAMAAHLRAEGFAEEDIFVGGPVPNRGNLVVRYRGRDSSAPAVLALAHIDVVEADPADWTVEPFTFLEQDGYFYGRGVTDDKDEAAIYVANLIRMKREGFVPDRDIIVALTADEEGGDDNGVQWLLANHRDRVEAAYALNEGGGGSVKDGRRISNNVQASEKKYLNFTFTATNPGGHSSLPVRKNAIYDLSRSLAAVQDHAFPVMLNEVTTAYFTETGGTIRRLGSGLRRTRRARSFGSVTVRAMILAAGLGTRMGSLSQLCPKPALPVRGVPVVAYLLALLRQHGVEEVIVNVSHRASDVERAIAEHGPPGVEVRFSHEPSPAGTGGGIRRAADFLRQSEVSIVMAGDMLLDVDLTALVERHRERNDLATLALRRDPRAQEFGTIGLDAAGCVRRIGDRFDLGGETQRGVFSSVRVFSRHAFESLPAADRFEDLSDWLAPLLTESRRDIRAELIGPDEMAWEPVGTPRQYLDINLAPPKLGFVDTQALWRAAGVRLEGTAGDVIVSRGAQIPRSALLERVIVWHNEVVPEGARLADGIFAGGRFHAAE